MAVGRRYLKLAEALTNIAADDLNKRSKCFPHIRVLFDE